MDTNKGKKIRSISVKPDAELDKLTDKEIEKIRRDNPKLSDDKLEKVFATHMMVKALKRVASETQKKEKKILSNKPKNFNQKRNHTIIQIGSHIVTKTTVSQLYDQYEDAASRNRRMDEIGEDIKEKYNYQKKIEEKIGRKLTDDDIDLIVSVLKKDSEKTVNPVETKESFHNEFDYQEKRKNPFENLDLR